MPAIDIASLLIEARVESRNHPLLSAEQQLLTKGSKIDTIEQCSLDSTRTREELISLVHGLVANSNVGTYTN